MATQRKYVWYYIGKIAVYMGEKIFWPQDHIDGDDIWVLTAVDGTMSAGNERMHPTLTKDPDLFDFKHHSAGWNTEVGISIKESRCIWINGPYQAGTHSDRVIFRLPGGLREKLRAIGKSLYSQLVVLLCPSKS